MKNLLVSITLVILVAGLSNAGNSNEKIIWEKLSHDFGQIEKNVPATATFSFINESDQDVRIVNVQSSCGCTVTDYTTSTIKPGESGLVNAIYNAAKPGSFHKTIKVYTDLSDQAISLSVKGTVSH